MGDHSPLCKSNDFALQRKPKGGRIALSAASIWGISAKGSGSMDGQGGGVTPHKDCEVYVDLIVGDLGGIESEYAQVADLFRAFAKHEQGEANFGYAEINKDKRLYEALSKTKEGKLLYMTLLKKMPLITVSEHILGDPLHTEDVKIFPLSELNRNPLIVLNKLYNAAKAGKVHGERHIVERLDSLNRIISIKPGLFGISLDVNKIFQTWIDKTRSELSPCSRFNASTSGGCFY
jgi:hypothetical protein